jgi:hypothetical protein
MGGVSVIKRFLAIQSQLLPKPLQIGSLAGAGVGAVAVNDDETENCDFVVREIHAPDDSGIGLPLSEPPLNEKGERLAVLEPAVEFGCEPGAARGRCLPGCHGFLHLAWLLESQESRVKTACAALIRPMVWFTTPGIAMSGESSCTGQQFEQCSCWPG